MSLDQLGGVKRVTRTVRLIKQEAIRQKRTSFSIMREMFTLYRKCSFGPNYYLLAGMANNEMSFEEKISHISDVQYHKALNILNPKTYRKITQHKLAEKAFLKLSHIPSSNFIGFLEPVKGFDFNGNKLTNENELATLLKNYLGQSICLKIPEGYGGKGFYAGILIEENDELKIKDIHDSKIVNFKNLLSHYTEVINSEGLLFESFIEQAEGFAKYNSSSVNTVRTWVLQTGDKIEVIGAYFRIGRKGSLTDNGDGGGIMCPVNPQTGELGTGLTTSNPFRDELEKHLDHDVQLAGQILPNWQEIISCSCETLRKLPYTRFAGLDVALTDDGPLIIEVNVTPDKDGAAYGYIKSNALLKAANLV